MNKNISVYGIYKNHHDLEDGIEQLRLHGFRAADISVLYPENVGSKEFAVSNSTKAPEGAVTGGASGAAAGGILGWLVGIGTLAIPGVGPLIAAGPIMAALAGMGAGAALGGATGALLGLGIPEYEAQRYEGRIKSGGTLVSVHCDSNEWADRAKEILKSSAAEDISSSSEGKSDYPTVDSRAARMGA